MKVAAPLLMFSFFAIQPAQASEQELRLEMDRLKTIISVQQADIIQLKTVVARAGLTPVVDPSTKPTTEQIQKYCYSIKRYDFKCIECGQKEGISNLAFDKCIAP